MAHCARNLRYMSQVGAAASPEDIKPRHEIRQLAILAREFVWDNHRREDYRYLRDASPQGIIILDLMMPVMDGWEFLEHQSHDPTLLEIPSSS
jgi:CheY-like chemotaxis protein